MILTDTFRGPLWVFESDRGCSGMLREYGEYSELELALMKSYISPDSTVLDIGAHIGAFTIPLAKYAKKVYAIEPQASVRELLERNIELHNLTNVEVIPYAIDFEPGIKHYTPNPAAMGSIQMLSEGELEVQAVSLDFLNLKPDFIKIDVEGMELAVLAGARDTLFNHQPYLLLERQKETSETLHYCLAVLGYCTCTLDFPIYTPNNQNHNPHNLYPNQAHQMIFAMPKA